MSKSDTSAQPAIHTDQGLMDLGAATPLISSTASMNSTSRTLCESKNEQESKSSSSIVSTSPRYRPTLSVKTHPINVDEANELTDSIYTEIGKYSLTPTTLKTRDFPYGIESVFFEDSYSYQSEIATKFESSVKRFGFNLHSQALIEEVKIYNKDKKESLDTKSIASAISTATGKKDSSKAAVDIAQYKAKSEKILTKLEKFNTNQAIEYLKKHPNAKAVVIDIFDREIDTSNIKIEDDLPIIHTVVLYEKSGKYLVIDPSNATFSFVLAGAHNDIRICFSSKLQIYKKPETDELSSNKWRDCIDIAVKLAFNLIMNAKLGFEDFKVSEIGENIGCVTLESIKENPAIREITNQADGVYKKLCDEVEENPFRMKQSSDVFVSKKATVLLVTLESISKKFKALKAELKEKSMLFSCQKLEEAEQSITTKIFSIEDYRELEQDFSQIFIDTLGKAFYNKIEEDVSLLAQEFSLINDSMQ